MECMWGQVPYLIIHHTVGGACTTGDACSKEMKKMQKDHMAKKSKTMRALELQEGIIY